MGGALVKVDIGHGRGWLAPIPAASLARIDAQLGRLADVNEAGRSPEQADENHRKWLAYLNGGPKAPYALPASQSIHCRGYAVDTDDWYNAAAAQVWRENGWRQTARYPGNPKKDEPWHGEYSPDLDQNYGQPASGGNSEDDMTEEDRALLRAISERQAEMEKRQIRIEEAQVRDATLKGGSVTSKQTLFGLLRALTSAVARLATVLGGSVTAGKLNGANVIDRLRAIEKKLDDLSKS